jgi:lactate dehydrogenase-like 2-hydroxyacid dehydrogenase
MTRILQHGRLSPYLEQALAAQYELHPLYDEADPAAYLRDHGSEYTALATSARFGADRALMTAMPNLKVISSLGVGYETFDLACARERGIQIGYTPDVLNDCVADTALGLLMDVARQFSASDRYVRRGEWPKAPYPLSTRVSGKRLGIVGLGRIGRVVARRASGFDMDIRYHNRNLVADVPYTYEPTLKGLAEWADFLVVISAGGAATRHLISADVMRALGPDGFLINVSRGSVVDEQALVKALQTGQIAGAGLDVYEDEPNVPPALFALDNVVLLPHVASGTHETRRAMADRVLSNFAGYFATGVVPVAVPLGS